MKRVNNQEPNIFAKCGLLFVIFGLLCAFFFCSRRPLDEIL